MKRINNYEFKVATYLGDIPEHPDYEIVHWCRNIYYYHKDDYIELEDYFTPKDRSLKGRVKYDKSLFEKEEFCYSVVFFTYDNGKYILSSIRADEPDYIDKDIITLINFGYNYLNNEHNNLHSSKE